MELKGIQGDKKPDAKPVKHRLYMLNRRVKEKVKKEIDTLLEAGLIFLVNESECVEFPRPWV